MDVKIQANFTPKQKEAGKLLFDHTNGITEVMFGGSAGGGKSYLAVAWLISCALLYPGTRWLMGRAVLKSLKETTLMTFFDVAKQWNLQRDIHWTFNTKDNLISFHPDLGGSTILLKDLFLYPSDPEFDSLGSLEITGAILDEVSQITQKAKDIVMSRIRYKLDNYNLIPKMLLVTNPAKNWAYTQFYKPWKENRMDGYRAFVPALPGDNEYLSKHYLNNLDKLPEASKQRLLFGNWEYDDEEGTLCPYENILSMFIPKTNTGYSQRYITADIARQGRNETVIGVWDGFNLVHIETIAKNSVKEAVEKIQELRQRWRVPSSHVAIDQDGVGGGVVDYLPDDVVAIVNNGIPILVEGEKENFFNLKSQLYFYLAQYINRGKISIRCNAEQREKISREVEVMRRKDTDKDGKWAILPKQDIVNLIGRSPDYSDMMAYRMIFVLTDQSMFL